MPLKEFGDPALPERFWKYVRVLENGCWEWVGGLSTAGYGYFYVGTGRSDGKKVLAHRLCYQKLVGEIPDGLDLDHLCRYRPCVNPFHHEPVTRKVNTRRGVGVGKNKPLHTHCPKGHELVNGNLVMSGGRRRCRQCRQASNRASRERRGVTSR